MNHTDNTAIHMTVKNKCVKTAVCAIILLTNTPKLLINYMKLEWKMPIFSKTTPLILTEFH